MIRELVAGQWVDFVLLGAQSAPPPSTAPTGILASPGDTQATISFTPPSSTGGHTISGYTATSSPGGLTGTVSGASAASVTVSGLTNGILYTFTVVANYVGGGTSPASAVSNGTTPFQPATGTHFLENPSGHGYFDASNTGYAPTGVTLTDAPAGNFTTSSNGQIIDSLRITGSLTVSHAGVLFKRSLVHYSGGAKAVRDDIAGTGRWAAQDSTFISDNSASSECLYTTRLDGLRINVSGAQDNNKTFRTSNTFNDSYFHDPLHPVGAHSDVIQLMSGGLHVERTTLMAYSGGAVGQWVSSGGTVGIPNNSCLQIGQLTGDVTFLRMTNNLMDGGNNTIQQYGDFSRGIVGGPDLIGPSQIDANRFGRDMRFSTHSGVDTARGAIWGPNNVYDDDLSPAL